MRVTGRSPRSRLGRFLASVVLPVLFGWMLMGGMHIGESPSGMDMGARAGAAGVPAAAATLEAGQHVSSPGSGVTVALVDVGCSAPSSPGLVPQPIGPAAAPAEETASCADTAAAAGLRWSRAPGTPQNASPPALELLSISRT